MIFQIVISLRNQGVMVPSGTTQRNFYLNRKKYKKGSYRHLLLDPLSQMHFGQTIEGPNNQVFC